MSDNNNNSNTEPTASVTSAASVQVPRTVTVKDESLRRLSVNFISNAEPVSPPKPVEEHSKSSQEQLQLQGNTAIPNNPDSDVDMDMDVDMVNEGDNHSETATTTTTSNHTETKSEIGNVTATATVASSKEQEQKQEQAEREALRSSRQGQQEEEEEEPPLEPPLTPSPSSKKRRSSTSINMPMSMGFLASPTFGNNFLGSAKRNIDNEISPDRNRLSGHRSGTSTFSLPLSPEYRPRLLPPTTPSSRDAEMFLSPSPNLKSPKLKSPSVSKESNRPIREISNSLKTRLNYAFVKLQNGWVDKTLPELESEFEQQQQQQQQYQNQRRRTSYDNSYVFGNTSITVTPQPSFKQISVSYTNRFAFGDGDTVNDTGYYGSGSRFGYAYGYGEDSGDNIARFRTRAFSSTMSTPGGPVMSGTNVNVVDSTPNTVGGGNLFNRPLRKNSDSNSAHQAFLKALKTSAISKSPEHRHIPNNSPLRWMSKHRPKSQDTNINSERPVIPPPTSFPKNLSPVAPKNFTEQTARNIPRFPAIPVTKSGSPPPSRGSRPSSEQRRLNTGTPTTTVPTTNISSTQTSTTTTTASTMPTPTNSSKGEGKPSEVNAVEMLMSLSSPKKADAEKTTANATAKATDGKSSDSNNERIEGENRTGSTGGDATLDVDTDRNSQRTVDEMDVNSDVTETARGPRTENDTEFGVSDAAT